MSDYNGPERRSENRQISALEKTIYDRFDDLKEFNGIRFAALEKKIDNKCADCVAVETLKTKVVNQWVAITAIGTGVAASFGVLWDHIARGGR